MSVRKQFVFKGNDLMRADNETSAETYRPKGSIETVVDETPVPAAQAGS